MRTPLPPRSALPRPADVKRRGDDRVRDQAQRESTKILYVHKIEDDMVVLCEADDTIIDQPIPWVGASLPEVGDAMLVTIAPGTGTRWARGERVAIGPITNTLPSSRVVPWKLAIHAIRGYGDPPSVSSTAAMGSGAGAITVSGYDLSFTVIQNTGTGTSQGALWTVSFNLPKDSAGFRPNLQALSISAQDARLYVTSRTTSGFTVAAREAPATGTQIAFAAFIPDA